MKTNHSKNYERFRECIDNTIKNWHAADLVTEIERRERIQRTIYGIMTAALWLLPGNEYHDLVEYVHEQGFNH